MPANGQIDAAHIEYPAVDRELAAHHAAADLAGEVGVAGDVGRVLRVAAAQGLVGDVGVDAQGGEMEAGPVGAGHGGSFAREGSGVVGFVV